MDWHTHSHMVAQRVDKESCARGRASATRATAQKIDKNEPVGIGSKCGSAVLFSVHGEDMCERKGREYEDMTHDMQDERGSGFDRVNRDGRGDGGICMMKTHDHEARDNTTTEDS